MLLGIGLHAALSFFPAPWAVQDTQQNALFGVFTAAVHGFRLPLFFLISGFFTMMLYRKRGMRSLLRQRAVRILLPCLLGLVTVIPLTRLVSQWAMRSAASPVIIDEQSLAGAIRAGNRQTISTFLDKPEEIDLPDPKLGITPLGWAALIGDVDTVSLLIERGAKLNQGNRDGSTPLHCAAFLGRDKVVEVLVEHGADVKARNYRKELALDSARADWGVTTYIANLLGLPQLDQSELENGRRRARVLLGGSADPLSDPVAAGAAEATQPKGILAGYQTLINSDFFRVTIGGEPFHLIQTPVFDHLWFLWFLCWMVALFGLIVWVGSLVGWPRAVGLPVLSAKRFLWLVPLTLIPQWFMGLAGPNFGPDTALGIIPPPHLLLYYTIFFGFGALYFDANDAQGQLGRCWWLLLPIGLLVVFPVGFLNLGYRPLTALAQVLYAWVMSFGLMGLLRVVLKRENRSIRYLSDASYWLYLAHLPLIIGGQAIVRNWPWPAISKFLIISFLATVILLITYQLFVRYTWIGLMLNGRRRRGSIAVPAAVTWETKR